MSHFDEDNDITNINCEEIIVNDDDEVIVVIDDDEIISDVDDNDPPGLGITLLAHAIDGIYRNTKTKCCRCGQKIKRKEVREIKTDMDEYAFTPKEMMKKYLEKSFCKTCFIIINDELTKTQCDCCGEKVFRKNLQEIKKSSADYSLIPKKVLQQYVDKLFCENCFSTINSKLLKRQNEELEKTKVACPICKKKYLKCDLSYTQDNELPQYWDYENNMKSCSNCNSIAIKAEKKKYREALRNIPGFKKYPAPYGVKLCIDNSVTSEIGVSSNFYKSRDEAIKELCIRAYLKGFDVVFNYILESKKVSEGTYQYRTWKATGDFSYFSVIEEFLMRSADTLMSIYRSQSNEINQSDHADDHSDHGRDYGDHNDSHTDENHDDSHTDETHDDTHEDYNEDHEDYEGDYGDHSDRYDGNSYNSHSDYGRNYDDHSDSGRDHDDHSDSHVDETHNDMYSDTLEGVK